MSWCQLLNENSILRRTGATTGSSCLPKNDWKAIAHGSWGGGRVLVIYLCSVSDWGICLTEPLLDGGGGGLSGVYVSRASRHLEAMRRQRSKTAKPGSSNMAASLPQVIWLQDRRPRQQPQSITASRLQTCLKCSVLLSCIISSL